MIVSYLETPCPKCKAKSGERCRALTTGRSTDTHLARASAWWRLHNGRFTL